MREGKKRKKESLSIGDRCVTAFVGALFAFAIGSVIWLIVVARTARVERTGPFIPFWVVLVFAGFMALIGFAVGPDNMVAVFERIWRRRR
jgi:hypothetical protein